MLGDSQVVLTGGAENMSNAPYALYNSRFGIKLGTDPVVRIKKELLFRKNYNLETNKFVGYRTHFCSL